MKIAARRRLALGGVVTTTALVAGLLIAPGASARDGGLSITPSGAENTNAAKVLTFNTTDADLRFGGEATFTRNGRPSTFTVDIDSFVDTQSAPLADRSQPGTANLMDNDGNATSGNVVGQDGPADAGTYAVSVTGNSSGTAPGPVVGGGNDTCGGCFTVLSPGQVSVSSVSPTSLRPGTPATNVSVLGNNFERGSIIELLSANGTVDQSITTNLPPRNSSNAVITDDITTRTELRRQWVVGNNAVPGSRDVRVTNLDGNSAVCTACFFVAGASLTSVTPTSAGVNDPGQADITLTFNGPQVTNGDMFLEFLGNPGSAARGQLTIGETSPATSNSTGTSITGTFNLSDAAPGVYQPVVRSQSGIVNACDTCRFTVVQRSERTPTVTSLDRTDGGAGTQKAQQQSTTAVFDVAGTNFSRGAQVVVSGTGVTTTAVEFVNASLLRATLQTSGTATPGDRDVTVVLTDGKTSPACNACYTVMAAPAASSSPSASTSMSPSSTPSPSQSASGTVGVDARYVGLASPTRVLDTRDNRGMRRSGLITLDLSRQITDPNATAAVLNVTVTNGTRRGFLVAYPSGNNKPGTSNVNFEGERAATRTMPATAGTQANEVVVALPANKRVSLFVDSASAHVIADLVGSFTTTQNTGGRVTTNAPVRALDTRDTANPTRRNEIVLDLTGRLPATSTAVILNVTVTRTADRGFVTVFPTGTTRPGTSNVNFERGQTQANEVTTQLGTGDNANKVSLFVDSANASVIVDLVGAVTTQQANGTQVFTALSQPTRALDTRDNRGQRRSGNVVATMPSSVPSNATGVVLNVTATNGTRAGFVTVFPTGQQNPGTSNVNFPTNLTQANEVISALGTNRSVTLFVGGANTPAAHVIVDVVGYLTPQAGSSASASPSRASASPSCTPGLLTSCPSASPSPSASRTP